MADNKYVVEYAETGRAKCNDVDCVHLSDRIAKGEVRIGKIVRNPFSPREDALTTKWYHASCFFNAQLRFRKGTKRVTSCSRDLAEFSKLKKIDAAYLRNLLSLSKENAKITKRPAAGLAAVARVVRVNARSAATTTTKSKPKRKSTTAKPATTKSKSKRKSTTAKPATTKSKPKRKATTAKPATTKPKPKRKTATEKPATPKRKASTRSRSPKTEKVERKSRASSKPPARKSTKKVKGAKVFGGLTFVVSGSFSLSQAEMKDLLQEHGAYIASSVTAKVTHVVAESIGSAKTVKASEKGLPIVSEAWVQKCISTGRLARVPSKKR